ncbi:ABC-2 transporter permease [Staphylococcus massiliensis]|uniref:ABC-2 transporter permease n=1 Tax=Staphylococcus massiliensis S46 TaxID=1229783 RepID=K9AVC0_9STAP|nr:ABC-2 transporter permease [Staphylococcus massiliensis]EKU50061.1 hypothetical protein C273_02293 [Staphylococcus massiliensis S46]MCG3399180.1 ABC-2 transporter permease [Staphylococcus massiliensis]MCG3402233.1 ABC-2 transporter permease [Staphylococcus massiliensis]MCG3412800.1 ABC-2 transporter permease [Staphylococcus massiliensis]POA00737.1 hypothetical protein CD133_03675 [Staphylococcus massiliensis CCUG 55927]
MKGLMLNQIDMMKGRLTLFFVLSCFVTIINLFNDPHLNSGMIIYILPTTVLIESIRQDETSGWVQFLSTTPVSRKAYVQSVYATFLAISLAITIFASIMTLIIHHSALKAFSNGIFGIGFALNMSVILAVIIKKGASDSKGAQIVTILLCVLFILFLTIAPMIFFTTVLKLPDTLAFFYSRVILLLLGIVVAYIGYAIATKSFMNKDL